MALPITKLLLRCGKDLKQEDVSMVKGVLSDSPGIGAVELDWERDLIAVVTAAQDGGAELMVRLERAGYPVTIFKSDEHASERNLRADGA